MLHNQIETWATERKRELKGRGAHNSYCAGVAQRVLEDIESENKKALRQAKKEDKKRIKREKEEEAAAIARLSMPSVNESEQKAEKGNHPPRLKARVEDVPDKDAYRSFSSGDKIAEVSFHTVIRPGTLLLWKYILHQLSHNLPLISFSDDSQCTTEYLANRNYGEGAIAHENSVCNLPDYGIPDDDSDDDDSDDDDNDDDDNDNGHMCMQCELPDFIHRNFEDSRHPNSQDLDNDNRNMITQPDFDRREEATHNPEIQALEEKVKFQAEQLDIKVKSELLDRTIGIKSEDVDHSVSFKAEEVEEKVNIKLEEIGASIPSKVYTSQPDFPLQAVKQEPSEDDATTIPHWTSAMQLRTFRDNAKTIAEKYLKDNGVKLYSARKSKKIQYNQDAYDKGWDDGCKVDLKRRRIEDEETETKNGKKSRWFATCSLQLTTSRKYWISLPYATYLYFVF